MAGEILKICNSFQNLRSAGKDTGKVIDEVTIFLSFDITESTKLKSIHPKKWANIIHLLLDAKNDFNSMSFWKFNGDEVLFRSSVSSIDLLCTLIENAFYHLEAMQDKMEKVIKGISLKGTMWIALTSNRLEKYNNNYRFHVRDEMDFSGRNIDEGFRLTKCSSMKKIAVDPKIIYILLNAYCNLNDDNSSLSSIERALVRKIKSTV